MNVPPAADLDPVTPLELQVLSLLAGGEPRPCTELVIACPDIEPSAFGTLAERLTARSFVAKEFCRVPDEAPTVSLRLLRAGRAALLAANAADLQPAPATSSKVVVPGEWAALRHFFG